jgi:hypothetical protein
MANDPNATHEPLKPLPLLIFSSRWLQLPLYVGLIAAQCVYVFLFLKELKHLVLHAWEFTEQQIMLVVLGLIDVVMISNLLVMVIVGGYETFVSRLGLQGHPDQPEWLSHVNAGRAQGQAGDGDHRHLLDPPAADLYRSGRNRPARRPGDRNCGAVADHHPHGLHRLGDRYRLGRPHDGEQALI